jgi:menaquinone-9 beta-reductase
VRNARSLKRGPDFLTPHSSANIYDCIIAGAGPAGTSAAIHLATGGVRVLLAEQKTFPRAKLCGEFISPECLDHFERLGVADQMISSGGASLTQTVFYSRTGQSVAVPSEWFGGGSMALGLSRAEMDNNLLQRAKNVGVVVLEDAQVSGLITDRCRVRGIRLKSGGATTAYHSLVTIDATGRARALARRLDQPRKSAGKTRPRWVAFKAHLAKARVADGVCEIYFYPGGYGGLSSVEGGLSNLCFIIAAKDVRHCDSDPERVVREIVSKNSRAAYTLGDAHSRSEWLSVSLETFGRRTLVPTNGMLTVGDAAAFIDPFTGSGMLMALESGEVAAQAIIPEIGRLRNGESFESIAREYRAQYASRFDSRMRISGLLRRAAFVPQLAEAAITFFSASDRLRRKLARATRRGTRTTVAKM